MSEVLQSKVVIVSRLRAEPAEVWQGISSIEGVNHEMNPWLGMTPPPGTDLEAAASGEILPLKLKGPLGLPLGTYPLGLLRLTEGEGFLEQTWMLPFLLWQHERGIAADPAGGTLITDSLGWQWRLGFLDRLVVAGVRRFFGLRHRSLKSRFGQVPLEQGAEFPD